MYLVFVFVFLLCLFFDMITKTFATNITSPILIIDNFIKFDYVENQGAVYGIGQGKQIVFILIAIFVVISIIWFVLHINHKHKVIFYSMAFLLAGTVGNCLDRIFNGYVVDFISIKNFPVFNLADVFIVCSIIIIVVNLFFTKEENIIKRKETSL